MREGVDTFIGQTFKTPKGGVITVIEFNGLKEIKKKYYCHCSVCSQDEGLWPYKSITSNKANLQKGSIPCGCSGRISKEWQHRILLERVLKRFVNYLSILRPCRSKESSRQNAYVLKCIVCSEDTELWPDGTIISNTSAIIKGHVPCGCSSNTSYKEWQQTLRIKRRCKQLNYSFLGFVGSFKGVKTKLKLRNNRSGREWRSTCISTFLNLNVIDIKDAAYDRGVTSRKPHESSVATFMSTGSFLKGTTFKRNLNKTRNGSYCYWDVICPKCSNDKYVLEGLCSGVFTSESYSLASGNIPCRCSKHAVLTYDQKCFRLKNLVLNKGGIFILLDSDCKNFQWVCGKGHLNVSNTANFTNRGGDCKVCTKSGFDVDKQGSFYIVRWFGYCKSYLKYGITNREVVTRVNEQDSASKHLDYEILYTFKFEKGQEALDYENHVKKVYGRKGVCKKEWLPDGYTETIHDTEDNLNFLINLLN